MANVGPASVSRAFARTSVRRARPVAALSADEGAIRATEKETYAELRTPGPASMSRGGDAHEDDREARRHGAAPARRGSAKAAKEHADRDAKELAAPVGSHGKRRAQGRLQRPTTWTTRSRSDLAQGKPARPAGSADVPPPRQRRRRPDHAPPAEVHHRPRLRPRIRERPPTP